MIDIILIWLLSGLIGAALIVWSLANPFKYLGVPPTLPYSGFLISCALLGPMLFTDGIRLGFKNRLYPLWRSVCGRIK